jgi:hypothetical protein
MMNTCDRDLRLSEYPKIFPGMEIMRLLPSCPRKLDLLDVGAIPQTGDEVITPSNEGIHAAK